MDVADASVDEARLQNAGRRLIQLRWWLLGGLALAVVAAPTLLDIALPWPLLAAVLILMTGFNLLARRIDGMEFSIPAIAGQLATDLVAMGVMLYLTGGATNPLVSLLLLPVAIAALSLPGRWVAGIATLAIALYSFLMLFSIPLPIADTARAMRLHLGGMWLTFVVSAILIAWFMTRMTASIRARDAQLAAAREEALRDAQVVALGQLAAGAAHELGTPLATMSVLAGELEKDTRLPEDVREDMALLRRQIVACKEIVGGLTQRAGIGRPGQSEPASTWLNKLLARWRTLWPQATCRLEVRGMGAPPRILVDPAIEQAITNLLNNAAKVAPQDLCLALDWGATHLQVIIMDRGPGFPPDVLRCCGTKPVQPRGEGSGIGLWLTRSAVERAGGKMTIENSSAGGVAIIELPLTLGK